MDQKHIEKLCEEYELGNYLALRELTEGVLNRNYILTTDQGTYFIKSVREKRRTHIPYIAEVEEFMYSKGIPAICMLQTIAGERFVTYDDHLYTVYPFQESVPIERFDPKVFQTMGHLLGLIHRAGSTTVPVSLSQKTWDEKPIDAIKDELENHFTFLHNKHDRDDVDDLFYDYIQLKLERASNLEETPTLPYDTLVHGDYHPGNLLLNQEREIIGVCDWEQASMNSRAYELARSVLYSCFNGMGADEAHIYDLSDSILSARSFIQGYREAYAISNEEIERGFKSRYKKLIYSFWMEVNYYGRGDSRANKFLRNEIRLITDFSDPALLTAIIV